MKSFYFWLSLAMGIGALLGSILRPGLIEIILVIAAANGIIYGMRKLKSKRISPTAL